MISKVIICASVFFLMKPVVSIAEESDDPIVKLPKGQIRGHVLQTNRNNPYYAFQQIPYASPPVEDLRFKEPQDPESWDEILDTTSNTRICFQGNRAEKLPENTEESEDCLYINVYTPVKPGSDSTALPVMVWIHGGGFHSGDGTFQTYGPRYLMDYDVVVVSFNYRLGPFGFLTTADGVIPANLGLKDQNFALQWVRENINLFGGDPSKVTIAGENAGGISVGYHLLSEKSKSLFRAGIMHSGTVLSSSGYQPNAPYFALQMGRALDSSFTSESSEELLELLENASAADINNVVVDIPSTMQIGLGDKKLIWLPIIENVNFTGILITGPMHEDLQSGNINRVPVMLGYNSEEEIAFLGDEESLIALGKEMDSNFSLIIRNRFNMTLGNKFIAGRGLRQIYTFDLFQQNFDVLVQFMSDQGYTTPIIRHAELQSKFTDVYLYQFSHKGMLGGLNRTLSGIDTVGNGEDLNYIWSNSNTPNEIIPTSDKVTQHRLLRLWTNFIKYLNPIPDDDNSLLGTITWPTVSTTSINYLNINRTLEVKTDPKVYAKCKQIIDRYAIAPLVTY